MGSYSTGWDGLLTGWAPVYYSDGSISNMVAGVDTQDVYIKQARDNTYTLMVVLLISIAVVLITSLVNLMLYQRKAKQAEAASEAKGSFLSRMSHEMRTPMNAIIGLCNMARQANDIASIHNYLDNINVASQHLLHVVDDVLDISKIESGKVELDFVPVSIHAEEAYFRQVITPQIDAKKQTYISVVGDDVPAAVFYDITHIRQIVFNLLSNAVKFTPVNGDIQLHIGLLEIKDGRCNLEWRVSDNGIGIDEENAKRLFQPFEQADKSTTRQYGGTGLGLAISKQLVEMMDGNIRVESVPGKGSTFIFNIWLKIADNADVAETSQAETYILDLSGRRFLVVEDYQINQLIAVDLLEGYGAQVDTALNGQEAVEAYLADPQKYDLIFMDIQMPVMDGYEATRRIRSSGTNRAPSIPIVAMTANVFKEDVDKALAAGMDGHVKKPFDTDEIERMIIRVLEM